MGRSKNGEAISKSMRSASRRKKLDAFIKECLKGNDLKSWRRGESCAPVS